MDSIRWLVMLAQRAGIQRIILNGSFVTDIMEPNDVDCALLTAADFPADREAEASLRAGLPFLDIAILRRKDFDRLVNVLIVSACRRAWWRLSNGINQRTRID